MFLLDRFFDGTFFTYGIEVMSFADRDQEDRIDPMIYVFPRMTKCTFHKFGTSGNIEKHDALCILPLNIVNEKIYIFIWFWLLLLGKLINYEKEAEKTIKSKTFLAGSSQEIVIDRTRIFLVRPNRTELKPPKPNRNRTELGSNKKGTFASLKIF